jgi:hypothetical protein
MREYRVVYGASRWIGAGNSALFELVGHHGSELLLDGLELLCIPFRVDLHGGDLCIVCVIVLLLSIGTMDLF